MDANQDQKVPQPAEGAPEVYPDEQQNNNSLGNMDSVVDGTTVTEATTLLGNAQSTTVGSSVVTGWRNAKNHVKIMFFQQISLKNQCFFTIPKIISF